MFKIVILSIALFLGTCDGGENVKCDSAGKEKLDVYTGWLLYFGDRERKLPESNNQMKAFCRETLRREKYIKEYTQKCPNALAKRLTGLLMYGISKKNKYFCTSNRGKKELTTVAKCANKLKSKGVACMDTLIDDIMGSLNGESKLRIPMMCCSYYKFTECVSNELAKDGTPICSGKTPKYIDEILDAYTGDLLSYICGDYKPDNDKCSKVIVPKKSPNVKRPISVLPPFIMVIESVE